MSPRAIIFEGGPLNGRRFEQITAQVPEGYTQTGEHRDGALVFRFTPQPAVQFQHRDPQLTTR